MSLDVISSTEITACLRCLIELLLSSFQLVFVLLKESCSARILPLSNMGGSQVVYLPYSVALTRVRSCDLWLVALVKLGCRVTYFCLARDHSLPRRTPLESILRGVGNTSAQNSVFVQLFVFVG